MTLLTQGMMTKIWGPPMWIALHTISFGYPESPTRKQKKDYLNLFTVIGQCLPCKYCRESYEKFIQEDDTDLKKSLDNRNSLTRWLYRIHNKVNNKLGVKYSITYAEVAHKYESYRAICTKTNTNGCTELKSTPVSPPIMQSNECPYMASNRSYTPPKRKDIPKNALVFFNLLKTYNGNLSLIKKNHPKVWEKRNKTARRILTNRNIYKLKTNTKDKQLLKMYCVE